MVENHVSEATRAEQNVGVDLMVGSWTESLVDNLGREKVAGCKSHSIHLANVELKVEQPNTATKSKCTSMEEGNLGLTSELGNI